MGESTITQFVFYILGIAGNVFSVYVASRWLVVTRRRDYEIKAIKEELGIHRDYLIANGIVPLGALPASARQ